MGEKISKDEFCSDDVKSTLAKWAAEPVDDMEAGTITPINNNLLFVSLVLDISHRTC